MITSSIAGLRPLIGGKPGRAGFNVKVANATDTGFWNMLRLFEPIEEKVLFAVPNYRRNIYGEARIRASGLNCCVVAIAKDETEVEETLNGYSFFQPLPMNRGRFGTRDNQRNQP